MLGTVNLEELCQVYLNTRDDWDKNFKSCKQFSQQIAKIPSNESRIDCFVVNTSPIRSDIEFIGRKYWDTLAYSLRSSILKDISTLQDFLHTSSQVLESMPPIEGNMIEEANDKCNQIILEIPKVSSELFCAAINQVIDLIINRCRSCWCWLTPKTLVLPAGATNA